MNCGDRIANLSIHNHIVDKYVKLIYLLYGITINISMLTILHTWALNVSVWKNSLKIL